ncbi:4_t:CDS:2 [Gigaspora rosea]|nr:4_t:CDS:2 [Gigaspora rosea]
MPEFAEFDINDDILYTNPIEFYEAQANTAMFHSWINGIAYNNIYEDLIMGSTSTYPQTNINWNNTANRIVTLYKDNRTEFNNCADHTINGLYNNNQVEFDTNDASQLYKELLDKKEADPQWYVEADWDPNKLAEKLTACALEEDKKTEYALFRASVPKAALVVMADSILPNINLDDPTLYSKNLTDIIAKSMLDLIDTNKIVEMWGLIRARWYSETSSDPAQESFLVAQKFEVEQSATMSWNGSVPYLSALNDIVYEMQDINRKTIDERKLYREAWGKARAALMVAIRRCDYNFISILDKYLNDCQELSSNSDSDVGSNSASNSESEDDADKIGKKKLDPKELMNPHKHKGKGRPKGTDRI